MKPWHVTKGLTMALLTITMLAVACAPVASPTPAAVSEADAWLAKVKEAHEGTTITISAASHPSTTAFQQMVPAFEQATGIKVQWDVVEEGVLADKQLLEFGAHTGNYDVLMVAVEGNAPFVELGALEPLDGYITDGEKTPAWFDYEDIMPAYRDLFFYKGNYYAIPFAGETVFLMYRKDLFDKYGQQVPQTWNELRETAKFFHGKEEGLAGVTLRAKRGWEFTYTWSIFIFPFGGKIIDPATGAPALNEPDTVKSLEYLISLKDYAPVGVENFSFPEAWSSFQTGKAAMAVEATAGAPEIENPEKSVVASKVGYAPLPAGPAGAYSGVWGWGYGISTDSKHKDAAWALIAWLTSKINQERYIELGGTVSRQSGLMDPDLQAQYPYYRAILDTLEQAGDLADKGLSVVPKVPPWFQISDVIGVEGSRAFAGEISVQEACDNMQSQVEEILKAAMEQPGG